MLGPWMLQTGWWACPLLSVPLAVACQEVKREAMAVNEADYTSVFVWPEERQRRCEVGVVVRRWCCSAHKGNDLAVTLVLQKGREGVVCILALWKLCGFVVLPVASQHYCLNGGP